MDEYIFDWVLENVPWRVVPEGKKLAQRLVLGKMRKSAKLCFYFFPTGPCFCPQERPWD